MINDTRKCWTHAASPERVDHLDVYAVVAALESDDLAFELLHRQVQPERLPWLIANVARVAPIVADRAVAYRRMIHDAPNVTLSFKGEPGGPLEPLPEIALRESVMDFADSYISWLRLAYEANVPLMSVYAQGPFEILDKARAEDAIRSFRAANGFGPT